MLIFLSAQQKNYTETNTRTHSQIDTNIVFHSWHERSQSPPTNNNNSSGSTHTHTARTNITLQFSMDGCEWNGKKNTANVDKRKEKWFVWEIIFWAGTSQKAKRWWSVWPATHKYFEKEKKTTLGAIVVPLFALLSLFFLGFDGSGREHTVYATETGLIKISVAVHRGIFCCCMRYANQLNLVYSRDWVPKKKKRLINQLLLLASSTLLFARLTRIRGHYNWRNGHGGRLHYNALPLFSRTFSHNYLWLLYGFKIWYNCLRKVGIKWKLK